MTTEGKTLLELLVTLAIIALLSAAASPALQPLLGEQQLAAASNTLHGALSYTRDQAIYRARPINLSTIAGNWDSGAQVYIDHDQSGEYSQGDTLLRSVAPLRGVAAVGNFHLRHTLRYHPDGRARLPSGAFQAGTLTLCPTAGGKGRQLIISMSGRVRRTSIGAKACAAGR